MRAPRRGTEATPPGCPSVVVAVHPGAGLRTRKRMRGEAWEGTGRPYLAFDHNLPGPPDGPEVIRHGRLDCRRSEQRWCALSVRV